MERISSVVERQLERFDGSGSMPRIVAAWPAAVGEEVVRNAWPARIARDGTLHVHTSSSVWAFELGQLAPRILERLAADNQLMAYRHEGFFHAMDTYREYQYLNELWNTGAPPWKVWE